LLRLLFLRNGALSAGSTGALEKFAILLQRLSGFPTPARYHRASGPYRRAAEL